MATLQQLRSLFPTGKSDEDVMSMAAKEFGMNVADIANDVGYDAGNGGLTSKRLGGSVDRYQSNLYGVGGAVARKLGMPGVGGWMDEGRDNNAVQADVAGQRAKALGGVDDWRDIGGVASGANFVGGLAAQSAPYLLESAAGGLAGRGLAGGARAALRGAETLEAAKAARNTLNQASMAGAAAASYPSAVGDILSNQREENGGENLGMAALGGAPYAGLNMVGVEGLLARGVRPRDLLSGGTLARVGKNAGVTALTEGASETGQEMINQSFGRMAVNPEQTLFNPEANKRYLDSFVGGAALGGVMGGAGGLRGPESVKPIADGEQRDLIVPAPTLVTEPEPLQDRINENLGLQRTPRQNYPAQFEAAAAEPSGRFASDADTGIEYEMDAGQVMNQQVPLSPEEQIAKAASDASFKAEQEFLQRASSLGVPPKSTPGLKALRMLEDVQGEISPEDYGTLEGKLKAGQFGTVTDALNAREKAFTNQAKAQEKAQADAVKAEQRATEKAQKEATRLAEKQAKDAAKEAERAAKAATPTAAEVAQQADTDNAPKAAPTVVASASTATESIAPNPIDPEVIATRAAARAPVKQGSVNIGKEVTTLMWKGVTKSVPTQAFRRLQRVVGMDDAGDMSLQPMTYEDAGRAEDADREAQRKMPLKDPTASVQKSLKQHFGLGKSVVEAVNSPDAGTMNRGVVASEVDPDAVSNVAVDESGAVESRPAVSDELMEDQSIDAGAGLFDNKRDHAVEGRDSGFQVGDSLQKVNTGLIGADDRYSGKKDENGKDTSGGMEYLISKLSEGPTAKALESEGTINASALTYAVRRATSATRVGSHHRIVAKHYAGTPEADHPILARIIADTQNHEKAVREKRASRQAAAFTAQEADALAARNAAIIARNEQAMAELEAEADDTAVDPLEEDARYDWNKNLDEGDVEWKDLSRDARDKAITLYSLYNDGTIKPNQYYGQLQNLSDKARELDNLRQRDRGAVGSPARGQPDTGGGRATGPSAGRSESGSQGGDVEAVQTAPETTAAPRASAPVVVVKKKRVAVLPGAAKVALNNDAIGVGPAEAAAVNRDVTGPGIPNVAINSDVVDTAPSTEPYAGYNSLDKTRASTVPGGKLLRAALDSRSTGALSEGAFVMQVELVAMRLARATREKADNANAGERARGADLVREKLLAARRRGELDANMVEFALWALNKNPNLAEGLGLSVKSPGDNTPAGNYNPAARIMTLFKDSQNEGTGVHEILHHSERMMPGAVQAGIATQWSKAYAAAVKKATPEQAQLLGKMLEAMAGSSSAAVAVNQAFSSGKLDYDAHYQLVNPSEYWAVNGTRIMQGRFEGTASWAGQAKQWLKEMIQKVKGLLGLSSDAAVLRGLNSVLNGDGGFQSKNMLSGGKSFNDIRAAKPQTLQQFSDKLPGRVADLWDSFKTTVDEVSVKAMFTQDLVDLASKVLPSAAKYMRAMSDIQIERGRAERVVADVVDDFRALPAHERGMGEKSVNAFIKESTMTGKWAFTPDWVPGAVADPALKARFEAALSPKAQDLVKRVFRRGHESLVEMQTAAIANADSEYNALIAEAQKAGDTKEVASLTSAKAKSLKDFQGLLAIHKGTPYAPLKRFGNYVVMAVSQAYKTASEAGDAKAMQEMQRNGDHYHIEFTDTNREARARARELESSFPGGFVGKMEKGDDGLMMGGRDMLGAFGRLRKVMADSVVDNPNVDKATGKRIDDMMRQLYLTLLSETSARKGEIHRKNVAGANNDMMRAFATQGRATAHFIAGLKTSGKVDDHLAGMRNETKALNSGREERTRYYNEIVRRHSLGLEYKPSPMIDQMMAGTSAMMLLTNPSYHLMNALQPGMMTIPLLAGRHGYAKSWAALTRAYSELGPILKAREFTEKSYAALPADVRQAIEDLANMGKIDIMMDADLGRVESASDNAVKRPFVVASEWLKGISQDVESMNRLSSAIAAYRLEKGQPGATHQSAVDYASKVIYETHGDYSGFNAPRFMRSGIGRLATQFKKFQLIQLSMFARLASRSWRNDPSLTPAQNAEAKTAARYALTYTLSHLLAMGGVMGLPGFAAIAWVVGKVWPGDDEPDDPEATLRRAIGNEALADFLLQGAPTLGGVNVSGRIGAGGMLSVLPYTDVEFSRKSYPEMVTAAMGPFIGGVLPRAIGGVELMAKGELAKGTEALLPNGLGNAVKSIRFGVDGVSKGNGDTLMPANDLNALDILGQAFGLPTTKITDRTTENSSQYKAEQFYKDRTGELKQRYTKAAKSNDADTMRDLRVEWTNTQAARRDLGFKPSPLSDLLKSPREQRKREAATQGGVQFNKGNKGFAEALQ